MSTTELLPTEDRNPSDWLDWPDLYELAGVTVRAHTGYGRSYRTHDPVALRLLAEVIAARGGHVGTIFPFGDDFVMVAHLADALGYGEGNLDGRWVRAIPALLLVGNPPFVGGPWWRADNTLLFWSNEDGEWTSEGYATVFERPDLSTCSTGEGQWRYTIETR